MRVLSLIHGESAPGGVFEDEVVERGHALDRWFVPEASAPAPAATYDAVMVFGGSAHPDQDDHFTWLAHEEEFLRDALAEHVPVFGVCLGAQMLARAAGARVGPAPEREIGWYEVEPTDAGSEDPVLGVLPDRAVVFQWHHYTYDVPANAIELARSPVCTQAFRLLDRPAWGIQFHAEVTLDMARDWIAEDPEDLLSPPEELLAESRARIAVSNELGRALCRAFLGEAARSR